MENSTQLYCIKLISNSGLKLQDNQLVAICDMNRFIPLEFLVSMRADNISKIWFCLKDVTSNIVKVHVVAYSYDGVNILDKLSKKTVNQSRLDQLSHAQIVNIPKNNVYADPDELKKIKFNESLKELKSVKRFLYNIEDISLEPSIDWKKVVCIEIRKYNAEYLEVISKKLEIEPGYLSHLKKLDASKVYWDMSRPYFLAFLVREESANDFREDNYKGLILWNKVYSFMTKKDKDRLLKMEAVDIKKLLVEVPDVTTSETGESIETTNNYNNELKVDNILDKISKFGMDSLTLEEKKFLDDESKK